MPFCTLNKFKSDLRLITNSRCFLYLSIANKMKKYAYLMQEYEAE